MRYRRKYQIRLWVAVLILLAGLTGCRKKTAVYDSAAEEITTEAAETAETETTGEEKAASSGSMSAVRCAIQESMNCLRAAGSPTRWRRPEA